MPHRQKRARTIARVGDLVAETDPRRPSGRLLRQAGMDASYVDLADATHLEFDYMRWMRIILNLARARSVLHVGGGACALARALAAQTASGKQEVCEIDAAVITLARDHLGLRRSPGLRVRHAEGRAHIAAQPDGSWDAIVIDAFIGARVPTPLLTAEALRDAARVAPMTLINVVDNRSGQEVNSAAAALSTGYPRVWMLGHTGGNTVVVGCDEDRLPDLVRVAARAAADPSPARLIDPAQAARTIAGALALRDSIAT